MKRYWEPSGCTGRDLERLDDNFVTETMDQIVPADSDGSHVAHGNVIMHTMAQMADGTIDPLPGGSESIDPPVSQAQRRAMYAAAEGHSNLGISQKVGKEFVESGHGVKNLPERKHRK
jgi:hypothetical protein